MATPYASEWVSDGDVPSKVAGKIGLGYGPLYCPIGRVVGFHTEVGADNYKIEVEAYAESICQGYLLIEGIKAKYTSGLGFVVVYGPYVTGIDKECRLDFPEQLGSILYAQVETNIATLVYKAIVIVISVVTTGT